MKRLATEILKIVTKLPGHTDRELAELIRGVGAPQQAINQEARLLAKRDLLLRQKRSDGLIGNYPIDSAISAMQSATLIQKSRKLPILPDFTHAGEVIAALASYILLPHPNVVAKLDCSVFPSIRDQKNRITVSSIGDRKVLLDDNTTPRWAMLWSHGYTTTAHPKGWTFAHVWARPKDPDCYTHLANLAMMPEYLASLSDKDGPLCAFLRYHAWEQYGWKPMGEDEPPQPKTYEGIKWCYLREENNPNGCVRSRVEILGNKRCKLLRKLK